MIVNFTNLIQKVVFKSKQKYFFFLKKHTKIIQYKSNAVIVFEKTTHGIFDALLIVGNFSDW